MEDDTRIPGGRISVAMIVRDESERIESCLMSFADHVDEIVVVDTGSVDDTVEVLAGMQARWPHLRIEHLTWPHDFAAARNAAMSFLTGDWAMWVDADDVVDGASDLPRLVAGIDDDVVSIVLDYHYAEGETIERERLVRPIDAWHWVGVVHERLEPIDGWNDVVELIDDRVCIVHRQDAATRGEHAQRNVELHRRRIGELDARGERPAAEVLLQFAIDCELVGETLAAHDLYLRVADDADDDDQAGLALVSAADCLRRLRRAVDAVVLDERARNLDPARPDAWLGLGASHVLLGRDAAAVEAIEAGLARLPSRSRYVRPAMVFEHLPHLWLAFAYANLGNADAAADAAQTALQHGDSADLRELLVDLEAGSS